MKNYICLSCNKKFTTVMGKVRHVQTKHAENVDKTYRVEFKTDEGLFIQYVQSSSVQAARKHIRGLEHPNGCNIISTKLVKSGLTYYELCRLEGTL